MQDSPAELKKQTRKLNDKSVRKKAKYVLCWLQQSIRAFDNPIIDAAIATGNKLKLPVVVYHALGQRYRKLNHPSGEKEIYGKVGRPWDQAMRMRSGVNEWLAEQAKRETYRVFVHEEI